MSVLLNQILRNDDVKKLDEIWSTLTRIQRRKEIFAQAVRCGGCDKVVEYCAERADNKVKSQVLTACSLDADAHICSLIAPFCKAEDIQKAALQALKKNQCKVFLALQIHNTLGVSSESVSDILKDINSRYVHKKTDFSIFTTMMENLPKNLIQDSLSLNVSLSEALWGPNPNSGYVKMQEMLDVFHCKKNLQEIVAPFAHSAGKRKM